MVASSLLATGRGWGKTYLEKDRGLDFVAGIVREVMSSHQQCPGDGLIFSQKLYGKTGFSHSVFA